MILNTQQLKTYLVMMLRDEIDSACLVHLKTDEKDPFYPLFKSVIKLVAEGKEISGENLWLSTQDTSILVAYMDLANEVDASIIEKEWRQRILKQSLESVSENNANLD